VRKPRRSSVGRDIRAIRTSLSSIARAVQRLAPLLQAAAAGPGNPSRRGRRLRLSAERRAALKLQGQYMGHLRSLKPRQKARVKALRAAKGVRPAIAFARRLARK
jgi:hypothetical protein